MNPTAVSIAPPSSVQLAVRLSYTGALIGLVNSLWTLFFTVNAGELEITDGFDDAGLRFNVAAKLTTTDPTNVIPASAPLGARM